MLKLQGQVGTGKPSWIDLKMFVRYFFIYIHKIEEDETKKKLKKKSYFL